jgi:hypothetical protein
VSSRRRAHFWTPTQFIQELETVQRKTLGRLDRAHSSGARTVRKQGHFPEHAAGTDFSQLVLLSVVPRSRDQSLTADHDEERDAALTLESVSNRGLRSGE